MTNRGWVRWAGVLGVAVIAAAPLRVRAQTVISDTQWKAAIVAKLPQFVDWPEGVLAGRSTVDLCVEATDAVVSELEVLAAGETVKGRRVEVRRVRRTQDLDGCQVLFLPATRRGARHPLLGPAASRPILTVSDDERFLDAGGIVKLRVVDGQPRFDIDAANAEQAGLRISARLLQLAVTVRGGTT